MEVGKEMAKSKRLSIISSFVLPIAVAAPFIMAKKIDLGLAALVGGAICYPIDRYLNNKRTKKQLNTFAKRVDQEFYQDHLNLKNRYQPLLPEINLPIQQVHYWEDLQKAESEEV